MNRLHSILEQLDKLTDIELGVVASRVRTLTMFRQMKAAEREQKFRDDWRELIEKLDEEKKKP